MSFLNPKNMMKDKNIVIIGGSTGIGLSAAKSLVKQGARVLVTGRNPASCKKASGDLGEYGMAVSCDAREEGSAQGVIDMLRKKWGDLHGLYHVAGGSGRKYGDGALHQMTKKAWEETLDLNLTSLMLSNQAAVKTFLDQKNGGAILNMSSVLGFSPSPVFFSTHAYAAAKSAVIGFSKSIASYYCRDNIRVNVIAPALVESPMSHRAMGDQSITAFIESKQPLDHGRPGIPSDLDGAAILFLSDAGSYITGQVLSVDGGWSITEGQITGRK